MSTVLTVLKKYFIKYTKYTKTISYVTRKTKFKRNIILYKYNTCIFYHTNYEVHHMKTGMIRRIDELGRIVIPKEIRKSLKLNMGDIVEIFVEDNKIMLKRFSTMLGLEEDLFNIAKVINETTNASVLFVDGDNVLISYGKLSEVYMDKTINSYIYNKTSDNGIYKTKNINIISDYIENRNTYIYSLSFKNYSHGLLIVIENDKTLSQNELDIIMVFKKFIHKQLDS